METRNIIKLKDDRTGITYAVQANFEHREHAIKKLQEKMDYDYFESLPAKERAEKKKKPTDITCPFCLAKTEVSSRKEKIIAGFFIFINTRLVDIFKCSKCQNEFMAEKLNWVKDEIRRENNVIENFENWKDAKREGKNPPEFISLDKVDELVISSLRGIK